MEPPPSPPAPNGSSQHGGSRGTSQEDADRLAKANEVTWLQVASLAEQVNDLPKAADAYQHVLMQNGRNVHALLQLASISRMQERFDEAVEYLNRIIAIDGPSGEVHGAIGHCFLTLSQRAEGVPAVLDCLRKCYDAYYDASLHLGAFNDPNLWYGIGLLYERYSTLLQHGPQHREACMAAEEALRSVIQAAPHFEKRAEVLYRCAHRASLGPLLPLARSLLPLASRAAPSHRVHAAAWPPPFARPCRRAASRLGLTPPPPRPPPCLMQPRYDL